MCYVSKASDYSLPPNDKFKSEEIKKNVFTSIYLSFCLPHLPIIWKSSY